MNNPTVQPSDNPNEPVVSANSNGAPSVAGEARKEAVERRRRRRRASSESQNAKSLGFIGTLRYLSTLSPVEIAEEVSDYFYLWYSTRNWRAVLAVIPPVCLLLLLGGFVLAGRLRSSESMKSWYREQASEMIGMKLDGATEISEDALKRERTPEDEAKLDLLLKRILQLGDENQEARYFVAISNLRQGKIAAARSMLETLVPTDIKGLDLAHAWLAEDLYRRSIQGEKVPVEQLKHHLLSALETPRVKYSPLLYGLLAKLLEQENNLEGAARVMTKAGEQDPKYVLEPILLYARRGLLRQATTEADALIARLNPKIANPQTPHEEMVSAYLNTAKALQVTNRIEATLPILNKALAISPDSAELKRTLSDSYRVMFRASMSNNSEGQAQVGIDILSQAIDADPTNIAIQTELAMLLQLGIAATEEKRIALIRHIALRGSSNAIRLLLAESALQRGDLTSATNDYEVVLADKPNLTIALNNLAMLYAMSKPPRLDEAKETIQKALTISPDTSEFYDTAGDIEKLAGNPQGAIDFYLLALEGTPERIRTREKLIASYQAENNTEEAEKQKGIATQILKHLEDLKAQLNAHKPNAQPPQEAATTQPSPEGGPAPSAAPATDAPATEQETLG